MAWDSWKVNTFVSLQTDEMGMQAQGMLKKLTKLAREVKVSRWSGLCVVHVNTSCFTLMQS